MSDPTEPHEAPPPRSPFAHPQWATGIVVVFGMIAFVAGLANPVWWLVGFPAILVLVVYVGVSVRALFRRAPP